MDMIGGASVGEPVTVWHFLAEDECGAAVYHAVLYEAAVVLAERTEEVRITRHGAAELQGFLFPSGHMLPITPSVGRDLIACGDYTHCESPTAARAAGALVYCFGEVIRPPRMRSGTMVEWVQFTANAIV